MLEFRDIVTQPKKITDKIREFRNRDDIRQWMYNDHIIGEEEHSRWLESLRQSSISSSDKPKRQVFVICDDDLPMGVVNLRDIDWIHSTASWGIYIAERTEIKKVGVKAFNFIMQYAFYGLGLKKLNSTVFGNNKRGLIFNQTCGMKFQGVFRNEIQFDSLQRVDLYSFGLTKREWEENIKEVEQYPNK